MGVLPLRLPESMTAEQLGLTALSVIEIGAPAGTLRPRAQVEVRMGTGPSGCCSFEATAAIETASEVQLLERGGILPMLIQNSIGSS